MNELYDHEGHQKRVQRDNLIVGEIMEGKRHEYSNADKELMGEVFEVLNALNQVAPLPPGYSQTNLEKIIPAEAMSKINNLLFEKDYWRKIPEDITVDIHGRNAVETTKENMLYQLRSFLELAKYGG